MKKLILIGLMIFVVNCSASTVKDGYSVNARSIFIAQLMPRMVGIVTMHGYELGLSNETIDIANNIRMKIKPKLKEYLNQLEKLELQILELSLKNNVYNKMEDLIRKIAKLKTEASLLQLECVEMAKNKYSKQDLKKIKEYLNSNKEEMLIFHKVIKGQ